MHVCVVLVCVCINSCVSMPVSGMYVHNCGNVGGMSGWRTRCARVRQGDEKSAPLGPLVIRRSSFTLCTSAAGCPAHLSLSIPRVARSGKNFFRGFFGNRCVRWKNISDFPPSRKRTNSGAICRPGFRTLFLELVRLSGPA